MLVLSIGLLGLAGLQVEGIRSNHSAYLRSQAVTLTYDLAERMRANVTAATTGAYAQTIPGSLGFDCMTVLPGIPAAPCTTAQMATADLFLWGQNVSTLLPGGVGQVQGPDPSGYFTISVQWNELDGAGTPIQSTVSLNVRP